MMQTKPDAARTVESTLIEQLRQLRSELGKDALFFGGTGVLIGILHVFELKLFGSSAAGHARLSDELLGDYMSFNALAFQMLGCMFLGGMLGLLRQIPPIRKVLLDTYDHVRMRLLQVASPMICLSIGIGMTSSTHFFETGSGNGLSLAVMLLVFALYVVIAYVVPAFLDPRIDWSGPRGKSWIVPLLTICLSIGGLCFVVYATSAERGLSDSTGLKNSDQSDRSTRR